MNRKYYYRLVLSSLVLNLLWAFLSTQVEYFFSPDRENPEGLITGSGFILCYALTFFLFIPRSERTVATYLVLTLTFGAAFLMATFVVPMFFINSSIVHKEYIFFFFSSLLASVTITSVVGQYFAMKNKFLTIVATTIIAFIATLLFFLFLPIDKLEESNFKRMVHPIAMSYCIWQVLTTITVGQSIIFKKASTQQMHLQ